MALQRVAVTGIGVISALGLDAARFWQALAEGHDGIAPMEGLDLRNDIAPLRFSKVAAVRGFNPQPLIDTKELSFMDRFAQLALVAAHEAIATSGIEWTPELRENAAVVTGSCMGGRGVEENGYWEMFHNRRSRVHPLTIPMSMSNAGASQISMRWGLQGPAYTVSTACASSAHAIGQAFQMVRTGAAPAAIAGGSEASLFFGGLKAWEAMRVVSKDTCRPFSADRTGLIVGEGAAMLVLEPMEAALARGARPLAEIAGFGASADAGHITQPTAGGPARAMRTALRDAGLDPSEIGYINAHGTATEANDRIESEAIRAVFSGSPAVSSTKSMHGHTLGAAGAVEAAATVLALHHGILPPTIHFNKPDPCCDVDVIANQARPASAAAALSNSFAFGGLNAVLAFRACR